MSLPPAERRRRRRHLLEPRFVVSKNLFKDISAKPPQPARGGCNENKADDDMDENPLFSSHLAAIS